MSKIAIITARGGSKRIPRKNIKDFLGKPIIAYSINAAIESKLFDEVMVSTDDKEIAEVAERFGAHVPFLRSQANSDDFAPTVDVILEVLKSYSKIGATYESGCCIYPTAPFADVALMKNVYDLMVDNDFDTAFPIMKFSFPIQRALKLNEANKIDPFQPEHVTTRSQDLESAYHDAGQLYWFKTDSLITKKKLWTDNSGGLLISEMDAHDIDHPEDWKIAEFKYKMKYDSKT